jgi:protein MpaA
LIIAGTHGDENSSIVTLSCALRTLTPSLRRHHVILAVNPDGCQLGLRANARGVDLNRNFRRQTGAPEKRFIAGTAPPRSATWCC